MTKQILTAAAVALVVMGCSKRAWDIDTPAMGDPSAPVGFSGTNVEVSSGMNRVPASKADVGTLGVDLGVYAFTGVTLPANVGAVGSNVWSNSKNLQYKYQSTEFRQDTPSLFWPASGNTTVLSFASYFPYAATGSGPGTPYVDDATYTLKASFADQSTAPNYGYAWAKLENKPRPTPVTTPQALQFDYKVAKLSITVKPDGTIGENIEANPSTGAGVKSIKVYGEDGLMSDYTLDLLTGTPATGSTLANADAKIQLKATTVTTGSLGVDEKKHVAATGYLVPAGAGTLTNGIVIEVVYDDGLGQSNSEQTYTAKINSTTLPANADANLTNGLLAGKNYKYNLKIGKNHITFTATVTDWVDVDGGDIELE